MELGEGVKVLVSNVMKEFSYHPLFSPYLNTSRNNPPQQYIHQCEAVGRLALRKPIRILVGDEIGLGKTLTALTIAKYLERIGRIKRCLIIVPRVLVGQWQRELSRMGFPDSRIKNIERYTLEFLKMQGFPEGYYIASMDLLKRGERIQEIVRIPWDLVIVDEVHKFGFKTQRFKVLGKNLVEAKPRRDVVFLSATPHRGDPGDYIARLQLLDPFLVEGWRRLDSSQFYNVTHGAIIYRRTKEDVNRVYECREVFPPAKFYANVIATRDDENEFVARLVNFLHTKLVEFAYEKGVISSEVIPLLTVLIFKRASSSPYAAMTTLERLLAKRAEPEFYEELIDSVKSFLGTGYEDYEYEMDPEEVFNEFLDMASPLLSEKDRDEIRSLRDMAKSIMEKGDSKLNALESLIEDVIAEDGLKMIVFTEYKDTLEYLRENLEKRHPEWKKMIIELSSEETRDERTFQTLRDKFERDPGARILLATDVVAEGVNLQVANILVNYEIPWSLIKVEQRIGRVWRLGQKREVEAYMLFTTNVADKAALNSMYEKLANLKRAGLQPRAVTGQEVLLYSDAGELARLPSVTFVEEKGKRKFRRITEYRMILTYLREGESGLSELISSIIKAKQEVEGELSSKNVLYKPKTREEVEDTMQLLGFKTPYQIVEDLKNLIKSSSAYYNIKVIEEDDGRLKVISGLEMPKPIDCLDDAFSVLVKDNVPQTKITLAAYGDIVDRLIIVPVTVKEKQSGNVVYREIVGVWSNSGEILRGSHLLKILSDAIRNCIGIVEEDATELALSLQANVSEKVRGTIARLLEPLTRYMNALEGIGLRNRSGAWARINDFTITLQDSVGSIVFVKKPSAPPEPQSREEKAKLEAEKKMIEEEAVRIVINKEKEEGRSPTMVSPESHYDIRSVHIQTGEVRLIEVKGHKGQEVYGELTDDEAELAEREGERYWLYIVYDVGSGSPKILKYRNPLKTMNWKVFERRERRFFLWPKDESEE